MARPETRDTVADRIVAIGKKAMLAQAEKIRQLRAERDAARAQVDRDGPRLYALARELAEVTADARKWHRLAVDRGDRLDGATRTINDQALIINWQAGAIEGQDARIAGLVGLNERLNADLDEVCRELARAHEEYADLQRRGTDHG